MSYFLVGFCPLSHRDLAPSARPANQTCRLGVPCPGGSAVERRKCARARPALSARRRWDAQTSDFVTCESTERGYHAQCRTLFRRTLLRPSGLPGFAAHSVRVALFPVSESGERKFAAAPAARSGMGAALGRSWRPPPSPRNAASQICARIFY